MERKNEALYTTGAFARYFGIKKDTLFYYDEIGLFSPSVVGSNGYRYYAASQIESFGTLLALKDMNVPLCKIREYFQDLSPEKLEEMAREQMEQLEEEIRRRKEIRRTFECLLEELEEGKNAPDGNVLIRSLPPERFIYSRLGPEGQGVQFHQWWDAYGEFVQEQNIWGAVSIGSLLSKKQMEREQFDRVERLFIHGGRKGVLREGGEYAVYYAKGPYEELTGKYRLFLEGIKRQGYRLDGDVYEEYLISELATGRPDQYVTRLTGKVTKTNKCS